MIYDHQKEKSASLSFSREVSANV